MSGTNDDFMSSVNAGLEAYKDGSRIVKQIKARRQGHTVLPPEHNLEPEDNLELPLAKATGDIRQVVTQGIDRYGSSFGEGDMSSRTPSLLGSRALMVIRKSDRDIRTH